MHLNTTHQYYSPASELVCLLPASMASVCSDLNQTPAGVRGLVRALKNSRGVHVVILDFRGQVRLCLGGRAQDALRCAATYYMNVYGKKTGDRTG